jgi:hypothetical protein
MHETKPGYWSVLLKRSPRRHLTKYLEGSGSGLLALCGKRLPEDARRGAARTISKPTGTECEACLKKAGYMDPHKKWLKAIPKIAEQASQVGFSPKQVLDLIARAGTEIDRRSR